MPQTNGNPIVASNLLVIANHDHAASAGEGASQIFAASYFPSLDVQYIYPWFPVTSTSWVIENRTNWPGMGCISTSSLGAILEYDIYLRPGTWKFSILYGTGPSGAFLGMSIGGSPLWQDGVGIGEENNEWVMDTFTTIEGILYSDITTGSLTYAPVFAEGTRAMASINSGRYKLRFRVVDGTLGFKSQGYIARIGYILVQKTA